MEKPSEPSKKRLVVILAAGGVAVIALTVGAVAWLSSSVDQAAHEPPDAKSKTADGLPPLRALPPAGTDLLPPLRTPPPDSPGAPASQQATAPSALSAPAPPPAKVAPVLPVTPAAPPAEKAAPATPPVVTAKRPEKTAPDAAPGALPGRYVGSISGGDGGGLTLVISSAEGGNVKATAALAAGGVCDDTYPMQGSMRSGKLELRATQMGGRANDCPLSLSLAVDGNRMTGSAGGGGAVQLKKR